MRIAIAGAGAVGSVIAAYLMKEGGHEVSLLARGAQLAALRARGLAVESRGKLLESRPKASDDPAELGPQDVILSTVKGYAVADLAPRLAPMRGPHTLVITAQNGIPWWYFYGIGGPDSDHPFETVDPGGVAWKALGPERAIGCVVSIPSEKTAPGHVHHDGALRLVLGAPRPGDHGARLRDISGALSAAGIEAPVTSDIRHAIWSKQQSLVGSSSLSVLTGANHAEIDSASGLAAIRAALSKECIEIANGWGVPLDPKAVRQSGTVGAHKASMLQDYEAGRRIELDAIVTAVLDLAKMRGIKAPMIEAVWALTRLRAQTAMAAVKKAAE
jgi:2-dehydropantoate 2-reductase